MAQEQRARARSTDVEDIRAALISAALEAYEAAGMQGLCPEGRLEVMIGAMRTLDLRALR